MSFFVKEISQIALKLPLQHQVVRAVFKITHETIDLYLFYPFISHVIEKCFGIRKMSLLGDYKLRVETQFGSRRKRTTEQAMPYLKTIATDVLNTGFKLGAVFLDLMKASTLWMMNFLRSLRCMVLGGNL